jgi:hypothetical protein
MLAIYASVAEMTKDLTMEQILVKVNQLHKERNTRMTHNKDYQKRKREEFKLMKAKLQELTAAHRTVFVGPTNQEQEQEEEA